MKWWYRRMARVWELRWIAAIGKIADLKLGQESIAMKIAVFDRIEAESNTRYFREKAGPTVSEPQGDGNG